MIYFLSIMDGEYIKIGYTSRVIEKRLAALQTGNPFEIKLIFSIDGSLKQEKEVHCRLKEVFERLEVFSNPVNEWYPGEIRSSKCLSAIQEILTLIMQYKI